MERESSLSSKIGTPLKFGKFRIIKNLVVMSISMMLISTAYDGLSMLQSTLNQEKGTASQAMVYTAQCLSSLILPKYVLKKFGCKVIFVISSVLFLPYIAANFYPKWFTLVFAAIFMGVAISMLVASQALYFNECVLLYCCSDSTTKENNSDYGSCIRGERSSKEVLKSFGENPKSNPHSGSISNATREEAIPRGRTCWQVHPKRSTKCTYVNKGMAISKFEDHGRNEYSSDKNITENDSPIENLIWKNEEVFSMTNPTFTTLEDPITKGTERQTSSVGKHCINYNSSENVNTQHEGNVSRNHGDTDVQHERNIQQETIDFQRQNVESITARFFGASGLAFHSAQVWGNLISYYALQKSDAFSEKPFCACGATLCRTEAACFAEENSDGTEDTYILTGISMGTAVLAVLLGIFLLDPLGTEKDPSVKLSLDNLLATFRQSKQKAQLCLVPISLYVGMLQGFYTADFTKSYIACALGPSRVGLVTAVYGLSCALSSPLAGFLVKYTGRIPVFLLMQSVNLSVLFYLLLWSPNSYDLMTFYTVACLLGVVTGTQWSQIPAFHGILFKKDQEAAFASYYLFNALGWSLSFACSGLLCTSVKLYALFAVSCLGIVGYLTAERTYYKSTKPIPLE